MALLCLILNAFLELLDLVALLAIGALGSLFDLVYIFSLAMLIRFLWIIVGGRLAAISLLVVMLVVFAVVTMFGSLCTRGCSKC